MEQILHKKYHLSTEGYYFEYRKDNYNDDILRATLFDSNGRQLDSIRVKSNTRTSVIDLNLSHTDVINTFETMVNL